MRSGPLTTSTVRVTRGHHSRSVGAWDTRAVGSLSLVDGLLPPLHAEHGLTQVTVERVT